MGRSYPNPLKESTGDSYPVNDNNNNWIQITCFMFCLLQQFWNTRSAGPRSESEQYSEAARVSVSNWNLENSRTFRLSQTPKKFSVPDLSRIFPADSIFQNDQGMMFVIIGCEISFILCLPRSCQNEKNRTYIEVNFWHLQDLSHRSNRKNSVMKQNRIKLRRRSIFAGFKNWISQNLEQFLFRK